MSRLRLPGSSFAGSIWNASVPAGSQGSRLGNGPERPRYHERSNSMPKKMSPAQRLPVPVEAVARRIQFVRGQKVMLSGDLAELYHVEPRTFMQAVNSPLSRSEEHTS